MPLLFRSVTPTAAEVDAPRPGDRLVPDADVVMDRAFTLPAPPDVVWPWIVQLGKKRAGWYLTRRAERAVPPSRRAARRIDARWQALAVGDVVPDWGGKDATFRVEEIQPGSHLVYSSRRGHTDVSWAIHLSPGGMHRDGTRVHLRLRLGPVKHPRVANSLGGGFDALTIAGMAAGLRERLRES